MFCLHQACFSLGAYQETYFHKYSSGNINDNNCGKLSLLVYSEQVLWVEVCGSVFRVGRTEPIFEFSTNFWYRISKLWSRSVTSSELCGHFHIVWIFRRCCFYFENRQVAIFLTTLSQLTYTTLWFAILTILTELQTWKSQWTCTNLQDETEIVYVWGEGGAEPKYKYAPREEVRPKCKIRYLCQNTK